MRALSYLLATAALLIAVRADGPLACGYASNGQTVDLSPLIVSSGTDYNSQPDAGGYSYELNVCAASTTTVANCQAAQAAVCQTKGGNFVATVAKWPASGTPSGFTLINNDITQGVELSFANGDSCFPTSQPRTARIQFVCGTTTVGQISTVSGGTSGCDYTITFPTSYACVGGSNPGGNGGGKGKLSGGWVFVIILLVTTFVYFVAGWGWNHYKHREEGWGFVQKCPNIEFWKKIPGLVKDGAAFTWAGIGSCIGRCTGRTSTASEGEGSYENVK